MLINFLSGFIKPFLDSQPKSDLVIFLFRYPQRAMWVMMDGWMDGWMDGRKDAPNDSPRMDGDPRFQVFIKNKIFNNFFFFSFQIFHTPFSPHRPKGHAIFFLGFKNLEIFNIFFFFFQIFTPLFHPIAHRGSPFIY